MSGKTWRMDHNPFNRPLGCNGRYGPSGANVHRNHNQPACTKCKASAAHYRREQRRGGIKPRGLKPCGTWPAAARHRAKGEPVCFPCKVAEAEYQQTRRDKAKEPPCAKPTGNSLGQRSNSDSNGVTA